MKRAGKNGFTVVELLIVIVVIAILATLVMVAYGNVQRDARNATRMTELRSWVDLFEIYKARKGAYPRKGLTTESNACLGTGFPVSRYDSVPRCRHVHPTGPDIMSYREADNAALMADFLSVAKMPPADKTPVDGWLVGPWVEFRPQYNEIRISTAIHSRNPEDCTKGGFKSTWIDSDGNAQICTGWIQPAW